MTRPNVLTDEEVVQLLTRYADHVRDCSGETAEADAVLRVFEVFTRRLNERLFVYLHMREVFTSDTMRILRKIAEDAQR